MIKKKITRIIVIATATITLSAGMAFASTDLGGQLLVWARSKVVALTSKITVENNELIANLQTSSDSKKSETKAGVTEYGKIVGDENVTKLEAYGDSYIKELENVVSELESEVPETFEDFVAKITKETNTSLDNKSKEIIKKIESSQTGFGGELWSVQNSAKQVLDRKIRVSSAEIQKELKEIIQSSKKEIEELIQNENEVAGQKVKENVDKVYNEALQKVSDSLYAWEVKAKDYLDEQSINYYNTQVNAIDKVVADELSQLDN